MIDKLISLADYLDKKGHKEAADLMDGIIKSCAVEDELHTMAWDALLATNPELAARAKEQTDDLFLTACGELLPEAQVTLGKGSRKNPVTCEKCRKLWSEVKINDTSDGKTPRTMIGQLVLAKDRLAAIADPLQYDDEEMYNDLNEVRNLIINVLNILNGQA